MTFEEIFNSEGLYRSSSFVDGVAFEIKPNFIGGNLELSLVTYKDKSDILPTSETIKVYDGLFKKDYIKVLNRNQLFPTIKKGDRIQECGKPIVICKDVLDSNDLVWESLDGKSSGCDPIIFFKKYINIKTSHNHE